MTAMQTESDTDSLVQLRVSVARMEGMLTQALTDQSARITNLESDVSKMHGRLSEKGRTLAQHGEQIKHNEARINDIEDRNDATVARVTAVIGAGVAAVSLALQFVPGI